MPDCFKSAFTNAGVCGSSVSIFAPFARIRDGLEV